MIKEIAWSTFKNTGNINAFLEFKTIESIEENINEINSLETSESLLFGRTRE